MKSLVILLLTSFLLVSCQSGAQTEDSATETPLVTMGELPERVHESSGLALASEHSLWTHNDRGNGPEFFEIGIHGELIRVVTMKGVEPVDMEDMGQDEQGLIYFADTGNNKKDRASLKIYVVDPKAIEANTVEVASIEFTLPDNGLQSKCHYDIEAIVVSQGKVYLFTKDRCKEKNNSLKYYSIPSEPGTYEAEYLGEFSWENPDKSVIITGADISSDGEKLALLSKDALHVFYAYRKDKFFSGAYQEVRLKKSKKEGLAHMNDCDLYITEEAKKDEPAHVYKLNLCNLIYD